MFHNVSHVLETFHTCFTIPVSHVRQTFFTYILKHDRWTQKATFFCLCFFSFCYVNNVVGLHHVTIS